MSRFYGHGSLVRLCQQVAGASAGPREPEPTAVIHPKGMDGDAIRRSWNNRPLSKRVKTEQTTKVILRDFGAPDALEAAAARTTTGMKTTARYRGLMNRSSRGGSRERQAAAPRSLRLSFDEEGKAARRHAWKKGISIKPIVCKIEKRLKTPDTNKKSRYFLG